MKNYEVSRPIKHLLCGAFCLLMLASSVFLSSTFPSALRFCRGDEGTKQFLPQGLLLCGKVLDLLKQQWMEWRTKKVKGADSSITVSVTVPSAIPPAPPPSPPTPAPTPLSSGPGPSWREALAGGAAVFSGLAQPRALVVLKKDDRIAASFLADDGARFYKEISGLDSGFYTFGLFSTDEDGADSVMLSFRMQVEKGTLSTVGGVFIPPTISAAEPEIAAGQPLLIYGQTVPESLVSIFLEPAGSPHTIFADKNGKWSYWLDTEGLNLGEYNVKAKALTPNGKSSEYGKAISFKVIKEKSACKTADLNCEGLVDLTDFSILLYWWNKTDFHKAPQADMNYDGKIDLIDFSIMLYWWGK